jgi:molybdate transport system ATP-binding protein
MSKVISDDTAPYAPDDQPIVRLDKVDVQLLRSTVLHELTWNLFSGEHWAIVGANGSGKTSFLRLISGNLWPAPQRGTRRYHFGGDLQTDAVEALTRITLVGHELQDRYVERKWNFDAIDVVLSGIYKTDIPREKPSPQDRKKASQILYELGLSNLANRPFLELSRGEQRRVLIARALGFNPIILILDEPLAGLDAKARRQLNTTIDHISKTITILCSYHVTIDLPKSINRVLRLDKGHVVESGEFFPTLPTPTETVAAKISIELDQKTGTKTTNDSAIIDIKNADIWLDERHTLTDITWQLLEGEHWQVTGSNGAGKTTFLRMLHGQLRPAAGGSINFPGIENPENIWILRQQIAWVSPELQADYWYPSTARQCISSGFDSSIGQTRKLKQNELNLVDELLEQFQLIDLAERNVKTLSYGQFRRVLIARAVVHKPKVLLLDEPWEGLDPGNFELVTRVLNQIISRGTHLVCVTHLHRNVSQFNRALEIEDGRITRLGKLSTS